MSGLEALVDLEELESHPTSPRGTGLLKQSVYAQTWAKCLEPTNHMIRAKTLKYITLKKCISQYLVYHGFLSILTIPYVVFLSVPSLFPVWGFHPPDPPMT